NALCRARSCVLYQPFLASPNQNQTGRIRQPASTVKLTETAADHAHGIPPHAMCNNLDRLAEGTAGAAAVEGADMTKQRPQLGVLEAMALSVGIMAPTAAMALNGSLAASITGT